MIPLDRPPRIAVLEDDDISRRLLERVLRHAGYEVIAFAAAEPLLERAAELAPTLDLVLSDVSMPGASGYELCRRLRAAEHGARLPVVLLTGGDDEDAKRRALDCGADDLLSKPVRRAELEAKLRSLLGIAQEQRQLAGRLAASDEKARVFDRLRTFVNPKLTELATAGSASALATRHHRDVTVMFVDLRRFTAFAERTDPEEVLEVLERFYCLVGGLASLYGGTIGHLAGDGVMVFFDDSGEKKGHAERALGLALATQEALGVEREEWERKGYRLDFGIGVATGKATIGGVGFRQYRQYSVVGPVANLASRLSTVADKGQVLVPAGYLQCVSARFGSRSLGFHWLKGIRAPVEVLAVEPAGPVRPEAAPVG